ncbi:MAG: iron-sulfur cluster insertion protein ErpA [Thaumarchaeota archaeon]|nr:iron-sulfur cluster insertion protein ErpA [Nitrososphaerota archaeon]MDG6908633.1 iron-sulfur cluster insertion protein ErpA [Nitrososphaerota archaeon]
MSLITGTSEQLILTDSAVERIKSLIAKDGRLEAGLRLYISGGGCAGMSYGMTIDDTISNDDAVVRTRGVKVIVDKLSLIYLRGSKIDYVENLQTSGFQIDNPNAASSCGCGLSFKATKDASSEAKQLREKQ